MGGLRVRRSLTYAVLYAVAVHLGRASRLEGTQLALVWPAAALGFLWLAGSWGRRRALAVDGASCSQ